MFTIVWHDCPFDKQLPIIYDSAPLLVLHVPIIPVHWQKLSLQLPKIVCKASLLLFSNPPTVEQPPERTLVDPPTIVLLLAELPQIILSLPPTMVDLSLPVQILLVSPPPINP